MQLLEEAIAARAEGNWLKVAQCLQQLPLDPLAARSPLSPQQQQHALDLALELLATGDFQQRWDAAKVLSKLGETAIEPLLAILPNPDAELELRWFSARILGYFSDSRVIVAFVDLLQTSQEEELAQVAARSLVQIGADAVAALTPLLDSDATRKTATRALAHIRHPQTVTPLLEVVGDRNPDSRATAIEALGSFHDPRVRSVLVAALKDPAASVRKEAAIALGVQGISDAVPSLQPLLYDLNLEVCHQGAIALGRIGSPEAMQALLDVLRSPFTPPPLKITILRALSWQSTPETLDYLQVGLNDPDPEVCGEAIALLGRWQVPQQRLSIVEFLTEFMAAAPPSYQHLNVKKALAVAFGELREERAIAPLQQLSIDRDGVVRLHALAALNKLPGTIPVGQSAGDRHSN